MQGIGRSDKTNGTEGGPARADRGSHEILSVQSLSPWSYSGLPRGKGCGSSPSRPSSTRGPVWRGSSRSSFRAKDPELFKLWYSMTRRPPPDVAQIARERFGARYVACFFDEQFREFNER